MQSDQAIRSISQPGHINIGSNIQWIMMPMIVIMLIH